MKLHIVPHELLHIALMFHRLITATLLQCNLATLTDVMGVLVSNLGDKSPRKSNKLPRLHVRQVG